jgi:vacuolar-type H+-ATPase subunit E/Vma4
MDETALERAKERLERAAQGRAEPAELEAALERARGQIEALAQAAAEFQESLPVAVQDALRDHFGPSVRHLAEVRGLMNQVIRRLERVEGDLLADRHARVDDLALLVDLVASGWRSVDERLGRIEASLNTPGATVYSMEERRG